MDGQKLNMAVGLSMVYLDYQIVNEMRKVKKNEVVKQSFRKELKKKIAFQLTDSLGGLRDILGDTKFNNRVQKASKLLSAGIKNKKAALLEKDVPNPVPDPKTSVAL